MIMMVMRLKVICKIILTQAAESSQCWQCWWPSCSLLLKTSFRAPQTSLHWRPLRLPPLLHGEAVWVFSRGKDLILIIAGCSPAPSPHSSRPPRCQHNHNNNIIITPPPLIVILIVIVVNINHNHHQHDASPPLPGVIITNIITKPPLRCCYHQ